MLRKVGMSPEIDRTTEFGTRIVFELWARLLQFRVGTVVVGAINRYFNDMDWRNL